MFVFGNIIIYHFFYRIKLNLSVAEQCQISNINNFVPVNGKLFTKIFIFRSYEDEGSKVYPKNLQIKNKTRVSRLPSKIFYEKISQGIAKHKRVFKIFIKDKQVVGVDRICRGEAGYVRDIQGDTKDSGTKFFFKVSTNEEIKEFNS